MGRVAYRKYSIGLKLSSFIGTEVETDVMSILHHMKDELPEPITIKLWYLEGEIKKGQLRQFMKDWGDLLAEYGSQMYCLTDRNQRSYDAWFNVLTREDAKKILNVGRFQYYCDDEQKQWMGILSFVNVLKFHCNDNRFEHDYKRSKKYAGRDSRKS
tara:strand:- start:2075 stop:2545 length:471 start_codon:yes stop_codon:yes gene_type:complete